MKRLFDIVVSLFGLVILFPVFIVIAAAIKIESRGAVFYRGVRIGRFGRPFRIFKFRSMVQDAEKTGASSTATTDMRVTKIGRLIRKFKLDEFSQLLNVLAGDMSLVGPRPQVPWAVDTYSAEERQVLNLRPGITDWASIEYHNEGEIIEKSGIADPDEAYMKLIHPGKMLLQLKYLRERTFWIDIKILYQTLARLFATRVLQND